MSTQIAKRARENVRMSFHTGFSKLYVVKTEILIQKCFTENLLCWSSSRNLREVGAEIRQEWAESCRLSM